MKKAEATNAKRSLGVEGTPPHLVVSVIFVAGKVVLAGGDRREAGPALSTRVQFPLYLVR